MNRFRLRVIGVRDKLKAWLGNEDGNTIELVSEAVDELHLALQLDRLTARPPPKRKRAKK